MIVADRLSRAYGRAPAIQDVSLRVERGEVVALLGPNGAGKSTLLQILAGTLRPDAGHAQVAGLRVPGDERKLGTRVGYVPQGESVYPELTVEENLRFFGRLHGVGRTEVRERAQRLQREMHLSERASQLAGALSGGLRQRLAIACSLMHDPAVLLLDEPATGLDPLARDRLHESLRALGGGRAMLVSTHSFEDAATLADRVLVLSRGRVATEARGGDAARLRALFAEAVA